MNYRNSIKPTSRHHDSRAGAVARNLLAFLVVGFGAYAWAVNADSHNAEIATEVQSHGGMAIRNGYSKSDVSLLTMVYEMLPVTRFMRPIHFVDLEYCEVDDNDVKRICELGGAQIRHLNLANNVEITDVSVEYLRELKWLNNVNLKGTSVTQQGAERLAWNYGYSVGRPKDVGLNRIVQHDPKCVGKITGDGRTLAQRSARDR